MALTPPFLDWHSGLCVRIAADGRWIWSSPGPSGEGMKPDAWCPHRKSDRGRTSPFRGEGRTVWNRRISPVAAHSDDRLLSEPTAGTQPCSREPLFLPLSRPRPCGTEPAHLGSQNENDYALEMDDDLGPMRRRKCGRGSASGNNLADPGGKPPKIAPKIGQQLTLLVPRDTHEREPGL
jgi:hypothetical protein